MHKHRFNQQQRDAIYQAIYSRRDMRHFINEKVDPETLTRLLQAAHAAPSVGYMQPWRFIRITDIALRHAIHALVEAERIETAIALKEREDEFMRLKVEGILECGELLVVALMDKREHHVLGRRTMPHMDLASASCAIQNMWLAARAEGLGMGWVSLFNPELLFNLLAMPENSEAIAIICLGHVNEFYPEPMLLTEQWAEKAELVNLIMENAWQTDINNQHTKPVADSEEELKQGIK